MGNGQRIFSTILNIASQVIRALSSSSSNQGTSTAQPRARLKEPVTQKRTTGAASPKTTASSKKQSSGSSARSGELKAREALLQGEPSPGQLGETATFEVDAPAAGALKISYAPSDDGNADAGEVVWTWIPYEERDGRGKDRPVLVIASANADHVYAVRLTSKSHDGDRDFLSIGSGPWDSKGRPSWVDIDQLYLVHVDGLRREAAALDKKRFVQIAAALQKRYGWGAK